MAETPTYSVVLQAGDSLRGLSVEWRDADGDAVDLTGFACELRVFDAAGALVLTLEDGAGLMVDGPVGKVSVDAAPSDLADLQVGLYSFILVLTSPDESVVRSILKGPFRVDGIPEP